MISFCIGRMLAVTTVVMALSAPVAMAQQQAPAAAFKPAATINPIDSQANLLAAITALKQQLAEQQKEITTLQAQANDVSALKTRVDGLQKEADGLKNSMPLVAQQGFANKGDILALGGRVDAVVSDIKTVKSDAATLKKTFDNHRHLQVFTVVNADSTGRSYDSLQTSMPSQYCTVNPEHNAITNKFQCTPPQ